MLPRGYFLFSEAYILFTVHVLGSAGSLFKEEEQAAKMDRHLGTKESAGEHVVPWIAALTTYFSYAVLILFGTMQRRALLRMNGDKCRFFQLDFLDFFLIRHGHRL